MKKLAASLVQARSLNGYTLDHLLAKQGTMHLSLMKSTKDQKEERSGPEVRDGAIRSQGQNMFALFD